MTQPTTDAQPRPQAPEAKGHDDPAFGAVAALVVLALMAPMLPEWSARCAEVARSTMTLLIESAAWPANPPF